MLPRRRLALLGLLLGGVLAGAFTGVAAGASDGHLHTLAQDSADEDLIPNTQEEIDPDATVTRIDVAANGTATWSLTIRMELDSNGSVEGFEAFEREFEANRSTFLGRFRDRMTGVVENAANVTGREMTATNFAAEVGVEEAPRRWGYVTYRFRWQGFAPASEDAVPVGDVFTGGLFLQNSDILIVEGPPGYEPTGPDPAPDETEDNRLQWNGPASFDDQRPRVEFVAAGSQDEQSAGGTNRLPLYVGGLIVALIGIGVVYVRWLDDRAGETGSETAADDATTTTGTASPPAGTSETDETDEGDEALALGELATDEDRVEALLAAEDGRMRQADVAERLDWSASKTSRVISDMTEGGSVEKLRIGRENVIDLVEDDGSGEEE